MTIADPNNPRCLYCWLDHCEHTGTGFLQPNYKPFKEEPPMTDVIRRTIKERGVTHGEYPLQAMTVDAIRHEIIHSLNYPKMTAVQRDALLMIAVKISRLCNGDHRAPDSWLDIAGYATLAYDYLHGARDE